MTWIIDAVFGSIILSVVGLYFYKIFKAQKVLYK